MSRLPRNYISCGIVNEKDKRKYQIAVVTRGIRSLSGIADSSIRREDKWPGVSLCSTASAETESRFTSPAM